MRDILLVRVFTPDAEGWGECVAGMGALYSSEYVDGAQEVIERILVHRILAAGDVDAARETAVLDAELRARGESFASHLGAVRDKVECGVSVGIMASIPQLLDTVD